MEGKLFMFILHPNTFGDFDLGNVPEFIEAWGHYYINNPPTILGANAQIVYAQELNIGNPLTQENIIRLLRWKDPRMLTHSDNNPNPRVQRVIERIQDLNNFRNGQLSEDNFKHITGEIFPNGHVWRIFLFHICNPAQYPIIDRYVKLAFCYHTQNNFENNWSLEEAWGHYQNYIQYFFDIYSALGNHVPPDNNIECVQALKLVDNALMAFGQFLEKYGLE